MLRRFQIDRKPGENDRATAERLYALLTGRSATKAFSESLIRRHPRGTPVDPVSGVGGGRFAPKPRQKTLGDYLPEVQQAAIQSVALSSKAEPEVTGTLMQMTEMLGGEMHGLENRLKEEASMARKIDADMKEKRIDASTAAAQINDGLRYTILFPADTLVDSAIQVIDVLAAAGYERYDNKFKNFWNGRFYRGFNGVFFNKNTGVVFELQFHTPESISVKGESHKLFAIARIMDPGPERDDLYRQIDSLWRSVTPPSDWERMPGVKME